MVRCVWLHGQYCMPKVPHSTFTTHGDTMSRRRLYRVMMPLRYCLTGMEIGAVRGRQYARIAAFRWRCVAASARMVFLLCVTSPEASLARDVHLPVFATGR